jgi:hypothetical protein
LSENWNSEEFISSRLDFATAGGKLFKEELQDNWENSKYKTYINDLRNNLASHTPFEVRTDNLTLQSFAFFCQKGEEDIDKLEDYLISNEIGDFRIAFSLWGIVFGFANMPKTLTNDLFLSDDLDYVSEVYKYIFKQVHGIELKGKLEKQQQKEVNTSQSEIRKEEESPQKTTVRTDVGGSDIINKLKDCKLKPEQLEKISNIYTNNQYLINEKFFKEIKDKVSGVGDAKIKNIRECLQPKQQVADKQQEQQEQQEQSLSLFKDERPELGKEFYKDVNVWYHIESLLPDDKKIKKQVKEDLYWFQSEYKKGESSSYYKEASRDNKSVIDSFERFMSKRKELKDGATKEGKKIDNSKIRKIYTESVDINKLISKLKSLYLHNER